VKQVTNGLTCSAWLLRIAAKTQTMYAHLMNISNALEKQSDNDFTRAEQNAYVSETIREGKLMCIQFVLPELHRILCDRMGVSMKKTYHVFWDLVPAALDDFEMNFDKNLIEPFTNTVRNNISQYR